MKIGILYICTGQYSVFRKDFYISAKKYFLENHEIHYFVFTDTNDIFDAGRNQNIHIIQHTHLGWPDATLMRFHTFLSAKAQLKEMDYLFFCNANLEIKQPIGEEILPSLDEGIAVTQHPGFYNKKNNQFTYERNKKSTAYISPSEGKHYVQGAFNGGIAADFLEMCEMLSKNIDQDRLQGIVAVRHDESHLNKYILDHNYKLLDPSYLYPETFSIPFSCKILVKDKRKIINVAKTKFLNKKFLYILSSMIDILKNIYKKIGYAIKYPRSVITYFLGINFCYSQTGEDLILKHVIHKKNGFYIDIGANHPIYYNNTYMLYKKGWHGINIEPNKQLIKKFQSKRPRDINLQVAGGKGGELKFFCFDPDTMSTCDPKSAEKYKKIGYTLKETYTVPVMGIKEVIENYAKDKEIDILSVDVEGYDLEVLQTNDRDKYKPHYVILETVEHSKDGSGAKLNHIYDPLFEQRGYEKFADTYINTIYRRK